MNDFFPAPQAYIIFAICIAILSLLSSLTKDRSDVSIGNWMLSLIIVVPWLYLFSAVLFELMKDDPLISDNELFEKRIHLIWHMVSILLIFFMIQSAGQIIGNVKGQDKKKAIIPHGEASGNDIE